MNIKAELELENGKKYIINFNGTEDEFKERVQFGDATSFFVDAEGTHVMVKKISVFKFIK
jgi:hypothetical protein